MQDRPRGAALVRIAGDHAGYENREGRISHERSVSTPFASMAGAPAGAQVIGDRNIKSGVPSDEQTGGQRWMSGFPIERAPACCLL